MRLLLDTHTLIGAVDRPSLLGRSARMALEDSATIPSSTRMASTADGRHRDGSPMCGIISAEKIDKRKIKKPKPEVLKQ